jgi:hypothetical protein
MRLIPASIFCCYSEIVEAVKMDSLQKLCSTLEPLLRRVVSCALPFFYIFLCYCSESFPVGLLGISRNLICRIRSRVLFSIGL